MQGFIGVACTYGGAEYPHLSHWDAYVEHLRKTEGEKAAECFKRLWEITNELEELDEE